MTKVKLNFLFLILFPVFGYSQDNTANPPDTTVYTLTEKIPSFVGGQDEMMKFIQENIVYPKKARKAGISGTCYISFIVEKDGQLSDIKVIRGIKDGQLCDDEALRCISIMPNWIPGKQNGKEVRVKFAIPIKFSLR